MSPKSKLAVIWLGSGLAIAAIQIIGAPAGQPAPSSAGVAGMPTESAGALEPPALGKALFVAKGCVACHAHSAFGSSKSSVGPVLTDYQPDAEYIRRWLRDPSAVKPGTTMPNLMLNDDEIEALIAFLQK